MHNMGINIMNLNRNYEYKEIKNAWANFIKFGKFDKNIVRPFIADSWLRCKKANLNPYIDNSESYLNENEILGLLEKNKYLIKISLPIIKMAANLITGSGFRIDLVDSDGYILKSITTENDVLEESKKVGSVVGTNRSELFSGTNGIALSLHLGEPVQIFGPEHYNIHYHKWTCASAPIYFKDRLIGVINISGHFSLVHKHTKGMAGSIASTIENAIAIENKIIELSNTNKFLGVLIDSIYEGLIVVDTQNKITNLNSIGAEILGGEPRQLIGKKLDQIEQIDLSLIEIFKIKKQYIDKVISLSVHKNEGKRQYSVSTRFIQDNKKNVTNIMAIFVEMKRIQRLASGIIGAKARFNFKDIIHKNIQMENLIQNAKKLARSDSRVLICGESGTGKELFAHAIHNESSRREKPFVAINCAALPRDLVESELFGYDEGSFTGAKRGGKPGKFELADGGTLLLDEIESMPLDIQPKLLRVIESNEIFRIGSNRLIPINVRIISSTNIELSILIQERKFREDLFYRINTTVLNIPPLRERKEDVLMLAKHFISKLGYEFNKNLKESKKILKVFMEYNWPGNIRELENIIENTIILSPNNEIQYDLLPDVIKNRKKCININKNKEIINFKTNKNFNLEDIEKNIIISALIKSNGNKTKAALDLGIDRTTLIRKIKMYRIK